MKRIIQILLMFILVINFMSVSVLAENDNDIDADVNDVLYKFNEMIESDTTIIKNDSDFSDEIHSMFLETEISMSENFEDNKILLTLTREESSLNKNYVSSDFPELDISEVHTISEYDSKLENEVMLSVTLTESSKQNVIDSINILKQDSRILCASPNHIITVEEHEPNSAQSSSRSVSMSDEDAKYTEELAYRYTHACCAKKYTTYDKATEVKVGILDGGIYNTADVSEKVVRYVDCLGNSAVEGYTTPSDLHGTKVANVLCRDWFFAIDETDCCQIDFLTGACSQADIYSLKIKDYVNGKKTVSFQSYCNAIQYAIANDIDILNVSMFFDYDRNLNLINAINNYTGLIICSVGFSNYNMDNHTATDSSFWYPMDCNRDRIIVVGNCSFDDYGIVQKDTYSDYSQTKMDLFAFGQSYNLKGDITGSLDEYHYVTGSSFSAPRVAAAAAVLKLINPNITAEEMKYYILAGVDTYSRLSQYCVTGGSLNIYKSAKMLISDLVYEDKTVFSGNFTNRYKLQIAAYCHVDKTLTRCYEWTYDSETNTFSDPSSWFMNNSFALEYAPYGAYNMHRSVAGDFDGDGLDEICTLYDYQNYIFIQGRDYSVHPTNHLIGADVHNFTGRVVALDYDNDGKDEIAALYEETSAWGHTKLYVWDFSGTKTGMSVTQRIVYDSGAGNYQATYATHRVASGDFDGDGYEEMGVVYYYPQTGKYSLHKFDISNSGATYTSLIFQQNNIDATKVTGRVVGCNYNGGSTDEILCLYDNNAQINNSLKIQGFYLENTNNSWNATFTYTNEHFDANNVTHLLVSGYFTNDGYEDSAVFFHLVDQNLSDNILDDKTRILICPNAYSCYNLIWDPKL